MARQGNVNPSGLAFDSQIMPRLDIHVPMPPGAATPARAPQPQPVSPSRPSQPAAAQSNQ
jgi:hypothetical protein